MSTNVNLSSGHLAGLNLSEPYEISLEEEGGLIRSAKIDFGYLSRGIERCLQKVPYTYGAAYAEKCDYFAATHYAAAYSVAVEQLGNIHVSERARQIRKILMELGRIRSHIIFLAKIANTVELFHVYNFCLREYEKYCDLMELYCGSRMGFGAIKVGGVSDEATDGFLFKIEKTFLETRGFLEEINDIFLENAFLLDRLSGLATIKKEQALLYGITGPNARASGLCSGDIKSKVTPTAEGPDLKKFTGDSLGRLYCRVREVMGSMEFVEGEMAKLSPGNYLMEISNEFSTPAGDVLNVVEGPRGQIVALVIGGGTNKPASVCFSAPSINSLSLCEQLLIGSHLDDFRLIIASMDISFSEVDR